MTTAAPTPSTTAGTANERTTTEQGAPLQQASLPSDQTAREQAQQEQSLPKRATLEQKLASIQNTEDRLTAYYRDKYETPSIEGTGRNNESSRTETQQTTEGQQSSVSEAGFSTPNNSWGGHQPEFPRGMTARLNKFFEDRNLPSPKFLDSKLILDQAGSWVEIEDKGGKYAKTLLAGKGSVELDGFKIEQIKGKEALKMTFLKKVGQGEVDLRSGTIDASKEQSEALDITGRTLEDFRQPNHYWAPLFSSKPFVLRKDVADKFDALFADKSKPKILSGTHVEGGGAGTVVIVEDARGEYKSLVGKTKDFEITRDDQKKTLTIKYINPAPYERKVPQDLSKIQDPEIRELVKQTNRPQEDFQRIGSGRGPLDIFSMPQSYVVSEEVAQSWRKLAHKVTTPKIVEVKVGADGSKGTTMLVEDANREYERTFLGAEKTAINNGFKIERAQTKDKKPAILLTYVGK